MKALRFEPTGLALIDAEKPIPNENEALIRVIMAGICATDLEIVRGYMSFRGTLGHEFIGRVEQAKSSDNVGRRVVGEINIGCRICGVCKRNLDRHCRRRTVLGISGKDGCFAEYLTLPLRNLHRIPDKLEDRFACFVEPVAACFEILEQVTIMKRDRIAVLGDGRLGILAAQVINHRSSDTTLVGKHERKLTIAKACGVRTSPFAELEPKSFDLVVDATGSSSGMLSAIELVRPRGTVVLKSTYQGDLVFNPAPLVVDEVTIIGSRCGPFEPAIAAITSGDVRVEPLIDAVFPLEDSVAAFERAQAQESLKVLIAMAERPSIPGI
jgi:threonine dehydrogenase-like Zn-dependent dehydrogenase